VGVSVPETAVDKYGALQFADEYIWFSGQSVSVDCKFMVKIFQKPPYNKFWPRIFAFDGGHISMSLFFS
jgi:hypothetical protein